MKNTYTKTFTVRFSALSLHVQYFRNTQFDQTMAKYTTSVLLLLCFVTFGMKGTIHPLMLTNESSSMSQFNLGLIFTWTILPKQHIRTEIHTLSVPVHEVCIKIYTISIIFTAVTSYNTCLCVFISVCVFKWVFKCVRCWLAEGSREDCCGRWWAATQFPQQHPNSVSLHGNR